MKQKMFLVAAVAVTMVASCGLTEIGGTDSGNTGGGVWGGPLDEDSSTGVLNQICYMTALDYQKGYDWRADNYRENVRCSLVVYADGRQIMKVPVGEEYETSSDPDMHRIIDGHLYTDYSTLGETVIKKDGAQILRYSGREIICGMRVCGDDVYTLGQNRNGEGFSYRKNGEIVVSREKGCLLGRQRYDNDSILFAFYESIKSSGGEIDRYYVVKGGKVTQIAIRDDIVKVWDVMCDNESDIYVASLVGVTAPVLFLKNGNMNMLPLPSTARLLSVSLLGERDKPVVEMLYSTGSGIYSAYWMNGTLLTTFPKGCTVSSVCWQGKGLCCAVNPSGVSSSGIIYRCGELHSMPKGYSCVGTDAMCMVNGILNVGLSSYNGSEPIVWKDGETETLKINGFISSISAY